MRGIGGVVERACLNEMKHVGVRSPAPFLARVGEAVRQPRQRQLGVGQHGHHPVA
jgi:hypothetical protein